MIVSDTPEPTSAGDIRGHAGERAGSRMRILLVDAYPLLRVGVATVIERQPDLRVVAQAENGRDAVDLYLRHQPDVAILDVRRPVTDGIAATREIREAWPQARVLILSDATGGTRSRGRCSSG